jgi:ribose transport system permease protein
MATSTTSSDHPPASDAKQPPTGWRKLSTGADAAHEHRLAISLLARLARYWLALFLIIEVMVFSTMRPDTFMTVANLQTILLQQVEPLLASLALTLPLIVGEFDLSVGAVTTAAAVTAAGLMGHHVPTPVALILTIAAGSVVGLVGALLVARFEVTSLIGSLGVATVVTGFMDRYTNGLAVNKDISPWLTGLATKKVLGIPTLAILAGILCVVVWFVLQQTVYGRQLAATGANRRAAKLLGLQSRLLIASTFVLSATLASLAGLIQLSIDSGANPTSGGFPLVITALTAVFLGATCFRPGHFNVGGTIVGILFLAAGVSGLSLVGLQAWVQNVFTGISLVLALAIAAAFRRAVG